MSLYAIGDLHLHFQTELKAKEQLKDRVWRNHEEKFQHGESRFHDSILGEKNGILYSLVSGDYLKWKPMKILGNAVYL